MPTEGTMNDPAIDNWSERSSGELCELFTALSKAQGQMGAAKKDKTNPHFKSSYADLASVWDACRDALSVNGLSVAQITEPCAGAAVVLTILGHNSGQWISSKTHVPTDKANAQGFGSALTYARRYGLSAIVGIAQDDDDGNSASMARKPTKLEISREKAMNAGARWCPGDPEAHKRFDACKTIAQFESFARYAKERHDQAEAAVAEPAPSCGTMDTPPSTEAPAAEASRPCASYATVKRVFKSEKLGGIAGCFVESGVIKSGDILRVIRDGMELHQGTIGALRRFKNDVAEVRENYEFGILVDGFSDLKEGDLLEVVPAAPGPEEPEFHPEGEDEADGWEKGRE